MKLEEISLFFSVLMRRNIGMMRKEKGIVWDHREKNLIEILR